jgi:hypothetical protein
MQHFLFSILVFNLKPTSLAVLCVPTIRINTIGRGGLKCKICQERHDSFVLSTMSSQFFKLPET